jgi:hypothetical protein
MCRLFAPARYGRRIDIAEGGSLCRLRLPCPGTAYPASLCR